MTATEMSTPAWLLRGINSLPGELRLRSSTLSFVAFGPGSAWPAQLRRLATQLGRPDAAQALDGGRPVELFAWPVHEVNVSRPWYYFGGGLKLRRQGTDVRVSFGRPAGGSRDPRQALTELREVGAMRARGKLWAATLVHAAR